MCKNVELTASEHAKANGFKSLTQVADLFSVTTQCLRNWHKHEPQKFFIVLMGCQVHLEQSDD